MFVGSETFLECFFSKTVTGKFDLFCFVDQESMLNDLQHRNFDVLLVTDYHVRECSKQLKTVNWTIICVDEAHKIKNRHSRIYQELSKFQAPFKLLVTATPLINSVLDLWSLLAFGFGINIDDYEFDEENLQIIGRLQAVRKTFIFLLNVVGLFRLQMVA